MQTETNPSPKYYRIGNTVVVFEGLKSIQTTTEAKLKLWYGATNSDHLPIPLEHHKDIVDAFEKWLTGR